MPIFAAIVTKYHGPSNVKGSRISATSKGHGRIVLSRDCSISAEENHRLAAESLRDKMKWTWESVGGQIDPDTYAWVFID